MGSDIGLGILRLYRLSTTSIPRQIYETAARGSYVRQH